MKVKRLPGLISEVVEASDGFRDFNSEMRQRHVRAHRISRHVAVGSALAGSAAVLATAPGLAAGLGSIGLAALGKAVYHHLACRREALLKRMIESESNK